MDPEARRHVLLSGSIKMSDEEKDCRHRARLAAIDAMLGDRDFLGPSGEVGVAIKPPYLDMMLPCYFCQGMMGCTSSRGASGKRARHNIIRLDWEHKYEYGHACAEAEVRLQMRRLEMVVGNSA